MTKKTTEERLERIEKAINGLAFFESRLARLKEGICPELDEIRHERHGSLVDQPIRALGGEVSA